MNRCALIRGMASVLAIVVAVGCIPMKRETSGGLFAGQSIDKSAKILLLDIKDGVEEDGVATGSGATVYGAIRDTLLKEGRPVLASKSASLVEAFEEGRALGCDYILRGTIAEWEDNATQWSGRPDVAALSLELLNSADQSVVGSATHRVSGSSSQAFARSTERFVPELVDATLATLFNREATVMTRK